jgi:hypothetical protein
MTLPAEFAITLITGAIGFITGVIAIILGWLNVKDLRQIIDALRERIKELEDDNHDLKIWAERLVTQVRGAGLTPIEFERTLQRPRSNE